MRIDINLSPDDPSYSDLRAAWQRAARRHEGRHDALARAARDRYDALAGSSLPGVVREPLSKVPAIARMLTDRNWDVDVAAREQFAGALAYFVDPDDLIPDDGSHFGFLDDALVLQLAVAEARHEWFAWCDYSDYIEAHPEDAGMDRAAWLQRRRERFALELRRRVDPGHSASSTRTTARGEPRQYAGTYRTPERFGVR